MTKAFCAAYIFFIVGMTVTSVGEESIVSVYQWYLPLEMFLLLTVPAVLGYIAGRDDSES